MAQLVVPARLRKLVGRLIWIMDEGGTLRWQRLLAVEVKAPLTLPFSVPRTWQVHSKTPVLVDR